MWSRAKRLSAHNEATGCLEWTGALVKGYPRLYVGKVDGDDAWRAGHRYSLERKLGRPLLTEEIACHQCDNPICINPDHLEVGSHQDNMNEMKERKRAATGEKNSMTSLTWDEVREIRAVSLDVKHSVLATKYKVSPQTIARIRKGETWREQGS